jgi:hypothetical protein
MDVVPVKAYIPRDLRRQAFSQFALRDMTFSAWVRAHLTQWLAETGTAPVEGQSLNVETQDPGRRSQGGSERIATSLVTQPQELGPNREVGA